MPKAGNHCLKAAFHYTTPGNLPHKLQGYLFLQVTTYLFGFDERKGIMRRRKQKIEVAEVKNLMPPLKGG